MAEFTGFDKEGFRTGFPTFQCLIGKGTSSSRCLAVTSRQGEVLITLYSVLLTLLFAVCWKLASMVVMLVSHALGNAMSGPTGSPTPERYRHIVRGIGLVGFWNAREPIEASLFLLRYLKWLRGVPRRDPHVYRPVVLLLIFSGVWLLGTYTASIFVATHLIVGNQAPANPDMIYVPTPGEGAEGLLGLQAIRTPATLRSLVSAEAPANALLSLEGLSFKYFLSEDNHSVDFAYGYTVSARDMGLQKWHDLKQEVSGRCDVDNSWFTKNVPEEDLDVYHPWGLENITIGVAYDGERKTAPRATAISFPYALPDIRIHQSAEHRFGIIPHSSHRASHSPGTDPWYETEEFTPLNNSMEVQTANPPRNRVKGGRPALSCTQKDVWSYNGTNFKNIYELTNEANLNFPSAWVTQLQMDFGLPRVIDMVNSAGPFSLESSRTFVSGVFDAESSAIIWDMLRLLEATRISSMDTFRNTLMVQDWYMLPNAAQKPNGQPQDGVGLFVIPTPYAVSLRLSVLVGVPPLFLLSTLTLSLVVYWGRKKPWYKKVRFAEGAYQFARAEDPYRLANDLEPSILVESMKLNGVVKNCAGRACSDSGPEVISEHRDGGVFEKTEEENQSSLARDP